MYLKKSLILNCVFIFVLSCQNTITDNPQNEADIDNKSQPISETLKSMDVHSFAKPEEALVTHLDLKLKVDFDRKELTGIATWEVTSEEKGSLFLDTQLLTIHEVKDQKGAALAFTLHEAIPYLGSALEISLKENTEKVSISYTSSPEAGAIQWLSPNLTAGKKQPFMFTQSQAILARTWVPCQDSPGIRFTYNAEVEVPKNLLALMSAENPQQKNSKGVYQFKMEQKIPSYLLALAVGDLEFQSLGERTGVYAEKETISKAVYELAETEDLLTAAEKLYGPYKWGRYDVLMLPPSFPFGGMENPRLTFATPTILAGDRSLVSLIAHELAHSWSGNLVTNATWNDFWLNEGFTVYFELRIMEEVYGKSFAEMLALVGHQDLVNTMEAMDFSEDTRLKLSLEGRNPDDGVSSIAYDKGYFLLRLIEEKVGRKWWDKFLNEYFAEHAFQSIDTESFLAYLDKKLLFKYNSAKEEINLEKWIYRSGLPENCPQVTSERFDKAKTLANEFATKGTINVEASKEWAYQEWVHFLRSLPRTLSTSKMQKLDAQFKLTASGNSEILFEWFLLVIENEYQPSYYRLERFLLEVGRRKFIAPLYDAMLKRKGLSKYAKSIYKKARGNYHYVSTSTIDKMMEESEEVTN